MAQPSDIRIPLRPGRAHYFLAGLTPAWVYHSMLAGVAMDGDAPETATTDASLTDPTEVSAGIAKFTSLTKGGYMTHLARQKEPLVVEAIDNPASATVTIVNPSMSSSRAAPTVPFKIGANEVLKAVTATTGATIGFLVRIDTPAR